MTISIQLLKLHAITSSPQTFNLLIKSGRDEMGSYNYFYFQSSEFIYILTSLRIHLNYCVFPVFVSHLESS